ncbi:3'-5' exonuclease [Pedobacter agri]|uniref:3'-5' exonuclease n=1 Tax=Pedobacter agri TaxID=454586 RepID=UPI00292F90E2|nr:3'-5' exonuclease [Pedobacter agri]
MQDYLLFLDTETSGLPKNWKAPYLKKNNWPYIIQIAWIVFDKKGNEIIRKNFYIKYDAITIDKSSQKIHQITAEFLQENGKSSEVVMTEFYQDIQKFKPLIIGHFIEFDYHMVNVTFQRLGMENVLSNLNFYCTMKASKPYVRNPSVELLRLNQFYEILFNEKPKDFHNALSDASNTAKIFYHLLNSGKINVEAIEAQNNNFAPEIQKQNNAFGKSFKRLFSL